MTEARMQETPEYAPGTFCWIEWARQIARRRRNFTPHCLAGTFDDHPMGPAMVYTMLKQDGKDVGGALSDAREMTDQEFRPTGCHTC